MQQSGIRNTNRAPRISDGETVPRVRFQGEMTIPFDAMPSQQMLGNPAPSAMPRQMAGRQMPMREMLSGRQMQMQDPSMSADSMDGNSMMYANGDDSMLYDGEMMTSGDSSANRRWDRAYPQSSEDYRRRQTIRTCPVCRRFIGSTRDCPVCQSVITNSDVQMVIADTIARYQDRRGRPSRPCSGRECPPSYRDRMARPSGMNLSLGDNRINNNGMMSGDEMAMMDY